MRFPIITLCGSTQFKSLFHKINKQYTLAGYVVLSVGVFSADEKNKEQLDTIHRQKIDMSDEVFIINFHNYIGKSTAAEIKYAKSIGKIVKYLEEGK